MSIPTLLAAAYCMVLFVSQVAPPAAPLAADDDGWTIVTDDFDDPLFYVQLSVGSLGPRWFLVDTGAFPTIVDPQIADALALAPVPASPGVRLVAGVPLVGAGVEFHPEKLGVHSITASISEIAGRRVDGILGADFFAGRVVELDYQNGRMRTRPSEGFVANTADRPVALGKGKMLWTMAVLGPEGGESFGVMMLVDTGYSGSVDLASDLAASSGLPGAAPTITTASRTLYGDTHGVQFRLASVSLGDLRIEQPLSDISPVDPQLQGLHGVLGVELLKKFTVTFDFDRRRMLLRPNERFGSPDQASPTGLGLVAKGEAFDRLTVAVVMEGSPAEEAGLMADDVVTSVDGRPASEFALRSLREYFEQAVGRAVRLGVIRGDAEVECVMTPRHRLPLR